MNPVKCYVLLLLRWILFPVLMVYIWEKRTSEEDYSILIIQYFQFTTRYFISRLLDLRKVLSVRDAAYSLVDKNHKVDILSVSLFYMCRFLVTTTMFYLVDYLINCNISWFENYSWFTALFTICVFTYWFSCVLSPLCCRRK